MHDPSKNENNGMKQWLSHRLSRVLGDIRPGEGSLVLLLTTNLTLALVCYYVLKTVREPLILATGGAELKTYAAGVQAVALMGAVPAYAWLTDRFDRFQAVRWLLLTFLGCIELFFLLVTLAVPMTGFAFYVWVGIFSLVVVAQFWSVANDLMSKEQGERLFPIVAIGASVGSLAGAQLASRLFALQLTVPWLLQISAGLLVLHVFLYRRIEHHLTLTDAGTPASPPTPSSPMARRNGLQLVLANPYLLLIAALMLILNLVNTVGEYILADFVRSAAEQAFAHSTDTNKKRFIQSYIGQTYGDFFSLVNVLGLLLQAFLASRLVKWGGTRAALLALPLVALGTYGLAVTGAGFALFRLAKMAENATDYSIMNTAKALLWLPTSREEKYRGKQTVDTFFVRAGDVLAAAVVFLGLKFNLARAQFATVNLAIILVWVGVAIALARRYQRSADQTNQAAQAMAQTQSRTTTSPPSNPVSSNAP